MPQGEELVLGHSIERLCPNAASWNLAFAHGVWRWAILDGYNVPTCYPNSLPDSIPAGTYTQDAAQEVVRLAEEMVTAVRKKLKKSSISRQSLQFL
jgi:HEPN domain-containing protein